MPSTHRRELRRLAMQILYQIDLRGQDDGPSILEALQEEEIAPEYADEAYTFAVAAWREHSDADQLFCELAPKWPTYRQPPVDRAILRLAYFEMTTGRAPLRVIIHEAVELAKQFSGEQSPTFINGVLDKAARRLNLPAPTREESEAAEAASETATPPRDNAKAWLDDALDS